MQLKGEITYVNSDIIVGIKVDREKKPETLTLTNATIQKEPESLSLSLFTFCIR